jgi:hypothetical protein
MWSRQEVDRRIPVSLLFHRGIMPPKGKPTDKPGKYWFPTLSYSLNWNYFMLIDPHIYFETYKFKMYPISIIKLMKRRLDSRCHMWWQPTWLGFNSYSLNYWFKFYQVTFYPCIFIITMLFYRASSYFKLCHSQPCF